MKTKKLPQAIAMLKEYKEKNGITYRELSEQTRFTVTTLNLWFNGSVRPTADSLNAIKQFLNQVNAQQFVKQANSDKTYLDSRLVAEWVDKAHKDLLRDIRGYISNLMAIQAKLSKERKFVPFEKDYSINVFDPEYYFVASTYIHPITKQKLPCYLVTQRGCEMIANKMTGVKGTLFTALYINEFHRLRNEVEAIPAPQEAPKIEQATLFDNVPQTPEERDLEYLKRRLLEDTKDARTIVSFAVGISKTWKVLKAIKDAKHITDYN